MTLTRNKFIEANIGLVFHRVRALNHGVVTDDLVQSGCEALCLAADRFDPDRGFAFATFAVPYIDGYILKHQIFDTVIKPTRHYGKFVYKQIDSLEKVIAGSDRGDAITLGESLTSGHNVEADAVETVFVGEFIRTLKPREREVLELTAAGFSQVETARTVGICQAQVSRMLRKLKAKYLEFKERV